MKPDNTLYATSMNKALAYLDENSRTLYYVTGYNCSCGNNCAKKITYKDRNWSNAVIIVCPCSQYAIESKRI